MKIGIGNILLLSVVAVAPQTARAQQLSVPKTVEAGSDITIQTTGSGTGTLYLVSPAGAFKRSVQLGEPAVFRAGEITNAGRYVAVLVGQSSSSAGQFDVVATKVASLSFLAKPSRLAVNQSAGISGVVYMFDPFQNLVTSPERVTFQSSSGGAPEQSTSVSARHGVAWIRMPSSSKAGLSQFEAIAGDVREKRIVQLVPGDPCNLRLDAHRSGDKMVLQTQPVRDCSGNPVPDGTIVTFTEARNGRAAASVDVPLKHDIAQTELPAYEGAVFSVATGVVMGNEIRMGER